MVAQRTLTNTQRSSKLLTEFERPSLIGWSFFVRFGHIRIKKRDADFSTSRF